MLPVRSTISTTARPKTGGGAPRIAACDQPSPTVNPYAPSRPASIRRHVTFRINSLLMVIAVIAVCLGCRSREPDPGNHSGRRRCRRRWLTRSSWRSKAQGQGNSRWPSWKRCVRSCRDHRRRVIEFSAFVAFLHDVLPARLCRHRCRIGDDGLIIAAVIGGDRGRRRRRRT